jgi:hypothetical protein
LQVLAGYASADELMADAERAQGPGVSPRVTGDDRGSFQVRFPGQVGYNEADTRDALGWVYETFLTRLT